MIIFTNSVQRITPTYLVNWWEWEYDDNRIQCRHKFTERNKSNGVLSVHAIRRMRHAMQILQATAKRKKVFQKSSGKYFSFKINFITLTLPSKQIHSDSFITAHMLQKFLRWLREVKGANKYVWKAETQQNGNIHYHITTSHFIHWLDIRKKWNSICFQNGYFSVKTSDPNSTDVHSVYNDKQIVNYMVKYLSKTDTSRRLVTCKIWDCSNNLKEKWPIIDIPIPDNEIENFFKSVTKRIENDFIKLIFTTRKTKHNSQLYIQY